MMRNPSSTSQAIINSITKSTILITILTLTYKSANQLEPLNAQNKFGNVQASAMIDSCSVVSLITKTLADKILRISPSAKWTTTKQDKVLKIFSKKQSKYLEKS